MTDTTDAQWYGHKLGADCPFADVPAGALFKLSPTSDEYRKTSDRGAIRTDTGGDMPISAGTACWLVPAMSTTTDAQRLEEIRQRYAKHKGITRDDTEWLLAIIDRQSAEIKRLDNEIAIADQHINQMALEIEKQNAVVEAARNLTTANTEYQKWRTEEAQGDREDAIIALRLAVLDANHPVIPGS